jgi:glucose/mannose-6-phosphate isomerase
MDYETAAKRFDPTNFRRLLDGFPDQLEHAITLSDKIRFTPRRGIENVVICGMGGSGIAGRILVDLCAHEMTKPIYTHADYNLPAFADKRTLVILVSYSGNTEETLSAFEEAKRRKCAIVSITSGGTLSERDPKAILIPSGYPPRQALAFLLVPLFMALSRHKIIPRQGPALSSGAALLRKKNHSLVHRGQRLARQFDHHLPVVYATGEFAATAYRFITQLNENAKVLGHYQIVPEQNHNEISAIQNTKRAHYLLLRAKPESLQVSRRFEFLKHVIGHGNYTEERFLAHTRVENMLLMLQLANYASYFLALRYGRDPETIPLITRLREALAH